MVNAGNGLSADGHEFLITPQNTALILSYTTATADLTSIGGPADQTVIDGVVQEIDIQTGKVLTNRTTWHGTVWMCARRTAGPCRVASRVGQSVAVHSLIDRPYR